jgi:16S rRNA (guanine966-N2)-methyltransferase
LGRIRIIAGTLRGRRIRVPEGDRVRPTADRVREALFDILGPAVEGARVLDLYAGTGALGLEAASRGACEVVLVERDRAVLSLLRDNVRDLGLVDRVRLRPGEVLRVLAGSPPGGPFDLVLADPPYAEAECVRVLAALAGPGWLAAGATLVAEGEAREPIPAAPDPWRHVRRAEYGRVALDFFRFPDSSASA